MVYQIAIDVRNFSIVVSYNGEIMQNEALCGQNKELYVFFDNDFAFFLDGFIIKHLLEISPRYIAERFSIEREKFLTSFFDEYVAGDFLLIVIEKRYGRVSMIRDPMGHRIAYYTYLNCDNQIIISNDCNQIYKEIENKVLSKEYVFEYLTHQTPGYFEWKMLPFEGIYRSISGNIMNIDCNGSKAPIVSYSQYFTVSNIIINEKENNIDKKINFEKRLEDSFLSTISRLYDNAFVSVSGGLDSTVILCLLRRFGLLHRFRYLNYAIKNDEHGYSEKEYLDAIEKEFSIKIEKIFFEENIPTLFNNNYFWLESEPGSLGSQKNLLTITDYLKKNSCKAIVMGQEESVFNRSLHNEIIRLQEHKHLSLKGKFKNYMDYPSLKRKKNKKKTSHYLYGSFFDYSCPACYNEESYVSKKLYEIVAHKRFRMDEVLEKQDISDIKYTNIVSPILETQLAFLYQKNDIISSFPLHSTEMVQFVLETPSYFFRKDGRSFFKQVEGLPSNILNRPKISSSTKNVYKNSVPSAVKAIKQGMKIEPFINMNNFYLLCNRIINGTFTPTDFRNFYSIISLEKFVLQHRIDSL